ncbi:MAG: DUF362 domain-containing protein [Armatimonadota bacterium]|nr:DUF362 domain-containing protein [Armatimonadota bacterium]
MENKYSRREFLRRTGIAGVSACGLLLAGDDLLSILDEVEAAKQPILSIASKGSPEQLVKKAVDGIGGIGKFVKKGSKVLIKPNLAWIRTPETAANTNPQVLAAIIKLCKSAGASSITVFDHTCDNGPAAFKASGAEKVTSDLDVTLISGHNRSLYKKISIPKGKVLKYDECAKLILDADCFINVPIAKVHGGAGITASLKNMMGTNWNRQAWHQNGLDQCIADYSTVVKANLIILDAVRILLTRGPKGPGQTKDVGQVIASTDPVAIDAYAATLLGKDPSSIGHISAAAAHGLGQMDLKKVIIKKI